MDRIGEIRNQSKTPVRLHNGRQVGHVSGSTLILRVQRSRHFFRRANGYSVDTAALAEAERLGARSIQFVDRESGEISAIAVECFRAHAQRLNFGWGEKLACPEKFYETPGQLGLFDGGAAAYAGV
jgi:hypothetical protein